MAKSRKLEETIAALQQISDDPTTDAAIALLRQVLNGKDGVAIAQASRLIRKAEIHALIPDLVAAFDRCMVNGTTDPGCLAKTAIADALYHMDYREEGLFLNGIRHVQREPVWGGKQDTAPALRGICALGLVRMNYPQVLNELADLLADPEAEARIGAVRAIAYTDNPDAAPLLRLRVLVGDEPQVFSECLLALLKLAPDQSLSLVTRFLNPPIDPLHPTKAAEIAEVTALALGESRLTEAFAPLQQWWRRSREAEQRKTGLLAIAMLRQDKPLDFLLTLIAEGITKDAKDAITALSLYQQDEVLWQRVRQAVGQRENSKDFGL